MCDLNSNIILEWSLGVYTIIELYIYFCIIWILKKMAVSMFKLNFNTTRYYKIDVIKPML